MSEKKSKFRVLQLALESYFSRYPRVTIKALSTRTAVPYATLRRIVNSEVNDIKDETIFRIINRVMQKSDQIEYIRSYYPILESMNPVLSEGEAEDADLVRRFNHFQRQSPHNLVIKLALTKGFTHRKNVGRLTGEYGLAALDEMMEAGLILEKGSAILVNPALNPSPRVGDICRQIIKDLEYIPSTEQSESSLVRHVYGCISPQGLSHIIQLGRNLLFDVEDLARKENGEIVFFFDLVSGTYDGRQSRVSPNQRSSADQPP